jgi:hypothetical protein
MLLQYNVTTKRERWGMIHQEKTNASQNGMRRESKVSHVPYNLIVLGAYMADLQGNGPVVLIVVSRQNRADLSAARRSMEVSTNLQCCAGTHDYTR